MSEPSPNPIKSLAKILETALDIGDKNKSVKVALAKGMDSDDLSASQVLDFYYLLNEAKAALHKLEEVFGESDNLQLLDRLIEKFMSTHVWSIAWQNMSVFLDQGNYVMLLKSFSRNYELYFPNKALDKKLLDKILANFRSIMAEVKTSNLHESIKLLIVKHLEEICSAIDQYEIYGAERISSAIESSLGMLVFNPKIDKEIRKDNLFKKVFLSIRIVGEIVFASVSVAANVDGYLIPRINDIKSEILEIQPINSSIEEVDEILSTQIETIEPKLLPPAKTE